MAELRSSDVLSKQSQINQSFDGRIADLEGFLKIQCFKIDLDFSYSLGGSQGYYSQILQYDKWESFIQINAEHVIGGCYAYTGNKTGKISNYEYVFLTKIQEKSEGLYCVFGDSYSLQWNKHSGCFAPKSGIQSGDTGCLILFYSQ